MAKERQLAAKEREQVLEFEGYLAAASSKNLITEKNSLLLSQVSVVLLYFVIPFSILFNTNALVFAPLR